MNPPKGLEVLIQNNVKAHCEKRNLDRQEFIGICLQSKRKTSKGRRLTADTAGRIFDGETGITLETAGLVAAALGVSIEDLFQVS